MGIAVALFDTPFAGERSLVRTFSAVVQNEIKPLVARGITFDTELLLRIFRCTTRDIGKVVDFCCDLCAAQHRRYRYSLTDGRVALFGVSMGVLQSAHAFTANGLGERLLGAIGHANLQSFGKSWGYPLLSDLAASPLGKLAEGFLERFQPELKPVIKVMQVAKKLKDGDEYSRACNPMTYIDQVKSHRCVRFLVGASDHIVNIRDAR